MKSYLIFLINNIWRTSHISKALFVFAFSGVFATSGSVMSTDFFIYPTKGQTAEQISKDKFECHEWAKQQTGIDPMRVATGVQAEKVEKRGGAFGGAARGATLGVIGGSNRWKRWQRCGDRSRGWCYGRSDAQTVNLIRNRCRLTREQTDKGRP